MNAQQIKVLFVEDDPVDAGLVEDLLRPLSLKLNLEQTGNYEVRAENSGARALAAALEFKPDLILLDVMMPDVDGGDVAASLRQNPALRKTPLVFLTAVVNKEELGASDGKIGGQMYIAKPLNVKGVIDVIERTLAK